MFLTPILMAILHIWYTDSVLQYGCFPFKKWKAAAIF